MKPQEVRQIRHELGMTTRDLANALGVWQYTVQRWEAGIVNIPATAQTALRLLLEKHRGL